jgi:hypothetical protein
MRNCSFSRRNRVNSAWAVRFKTVFFASEDDAGLDALERKYPNAATEWAWQYIFSSGSFSIDPRSGVEHRHHIDEKLLQRAMKKAVQASGIAKLATPHATSFVCNPFTRFGL